MKKIFHPVIPVVVILIAIFLTMSLSFNSETTHGNLIAGNESIALWSFSSEQNFTLRGERRIIPNEYKIASVNFEALVATLATAPEESFNGASVNPLIFQLPKPDGTFERFYVTSYQMMEPELAVKYPEIRTFTINGIDDPYAVGTIDHTPHGFHGMVLTPKGDFFIDPFSTNETSNYITYYKSDFTKDAEFSCIVEGIDDSQINFSPDMMVSTGEQLRTYRLANAATGE